MTGFELKNVKEIQLEITTKCNAACPQCPRNIMGYGTNPYMHVTHLSLKTLKNIFHMDLCKQLNQVFLCGGYGDPAVYPWILDLIEDLRNKNPDLNILIHTNGGVRSPNWWFKLGELIGKKGNVAFGIDGLEDTLHLYRQNVNYNRVMENAQAFIDGGGRARWSFIVFNHNEHQVEKARQISESMGFSEFMPRKTGRFYDQINHCKIDYWPVYDKKGNFSHYIHPPKKPEYRNDSLEDVENLKKRYGSMYNYFEQTEIHCDALENKKLVISGDGLVMPCNFFTHALYDMRFHEPKKQWPGSSDPLNQVKPNREIQKMVERWGKENLSIYNYYIEDVMQSGFWNEIVERWQKTSFKQGKLFECSFVCGREFTKCWDQGGNKK